MRVSGEGEGEHMHEMYMCDMNMHIYMHMHVHVHACTCACMYTHICTYSTGINMHMFAHIYVCIPLGIHAQCIQQHAHAYACIREAVVELEHGAGGHEGARRAADVRCGNVGCGMWDVRCGM